MLGLILASYLASVPLNAQNPPEEPPTIQLKAGLHFVCFVGVGNQIWIVLSSASPKGINYLLINTDGEVVMVVFEPFDKA